MTRTYAKSTHEQYKPEQGKPAYVHTMREPRHLSVLRNNSLVAEVLEDLRTDEEMPYVNKVSGRNITPVTSWDDIYSTRRIVAKDDEIKSDSRYWVGNERWMRHRLAYLQVIRHDILAEIDAINSKGFDGYGINRRKLVELSARLTGYKWFARRGIDGEIAELKAQLESLDK